MQSKDIAPAVWPGAVIGVVLLLVAAGADRSAFAVAVLFGALLVAVWGATRRPPVPSSPESDLARAARELREERERTPA